MVAARMVMVEWGRQLAAGQAISTLNSALAQGRSPTGGPLARLTGRVAETVRRAAEFTTPEAEAQGRSHTGGQFAGLAERVAEECAVPGSSRAQRPSGPFVNCCPTSNGRGRD
jgi:hypothetical protein